MTPLELQLQPAEPLNERVAHLIGAEESISMVGRTALDLAEAVGRPDLASDRVFQTICKKMSRRVGAKPIDYAAGDILDLHAFVQPITLLGHFQRVHYATLIVLLTHDQVTLDEIMDLAGGYEKQAIQSALSTIKKIANDVGALECDDGVYRLVKQKSPDPTS